MSENSPRSITPEQQQKLKEWLDAKAKHLYGADGMVHCPVCNSDDFVVGNMIAAIEITGDSGAVKIPVEGSASTDHAGGYAIIPLRCGNCAYMMLFDAGQIGITNF